MALRQATAIGTVACPTNPPLISFPRNCDHRILEKLGPGGLYWMWESRGSKWCRWWAVVDIVSAQHRCPWPGQDTHLPTAVNVGYQQSQLPPFSRELSLAGGSCSAQRLHNPRMQSIAKAWLNQEYKRCSSCLKWGHFAVWFTLQGPITTLWIRPREDLTSTFSLPPLKYFLRTLPNKSHGPEPLFQALLLGNKTKTFFCLCLMHLWSLITQYHYA